MDNLDAFYAGAAEHFNGGDGKLGGGKMTVGGLDDLKGYGSGIISKAKEKLIRNIAKAAKDKLKISGITPDAVDINVVVGQFVKLFPDPRPGKGNSLSFGKNKRIHENVCKVMAEVINKEFGSTVIDVRADSAEMCEATSEIMNTLFVGMHGEFISVRDDIRKSLANIETLRMYLEQIHTALGNKLAASDDTEIKSAAAGIRELQRAVLLELNRQIKLLENMLNIVAPAEKSLNELLQKQKDLKTLVSKIKAGPGEGKFGEKVSYMLSGIGTTSYAAAVIDAALKKLGMSVKDYAGVKSLADLKKAVNKSALDKFDDAKSAEEMLSLLKAVDIIIANDYRHDDIVKHLSGKVGGAAKKHKAKKTKKHGKGEVVGGVKLEKRLEKTKDVRGKMFKIFNQRLNDIFHKISASIQIAVKKIGKEIPLGDDLRKFVSAFSLLDNFRQMNIYYALSGYAQSIQAKELREKFISRVNNVIGAIDDMKSVSVLSDLKSSFRALVNLVEEMAEAFSKIPAVAPKYCDKEARGAAEGPEMSDGDRVDEAILGGSDIGEITRVAYTLETAQKEMKYYYYTARARSGFAISAKELESIRCEYPKVLGEAIAQKRDALRDGIDKYNKAIKGDNTGDGISDALNKSLRAEDKESAEKKKKTIRDFSNMQAKARDGLYKVAEAVDRLMIEFTDAALKNPDDIEELKVMLDSTEIIPDWFNKKAGDLLCDFFEQFPTEVQFGMGLDFEGTDVAGGNEHYYQKINLDKTQPMFTVAAGPRNRVTFENKIGADCGPTAKNDFVGTNVGGDVSYNKVLDWINAGSNITTPAVPSPAERRKYLRCRIDLVKAECEKGFKCMGPGNPFVALDVDKAKSLCDNVSSALDNMSVLKNVIATFVEIGKRLGGEKLYKKTNMTPFQMYSALVEYIKCSAIAHKTGKQTLSGADLLIKHKNFTVGLTDDVDGLIGIDAGDSYEYRIDYKLDGGSVIAAPIKDVLTDDAGAKIDWYSECQHEDELFQMVIKSMVAKVFTVLGIYSLFNRPIEEQSFGNNFTDVRLVLGGSDVLPKIMDEAMELYVRLPLLAEFYRIVFDFDNLREADNNLITMVPDESGLFGPFINIMFNRTRYVEEGSYSSTDVSMIIAEINRICSHFGGRKNIVSEVVGEFIREVNQRFGVLDRATRLKFLEEKYHGDLSTMPEKDEEIVNMSILPGGEYGDEPSRPAYSDRYRRMGEIGEVGAGKYKYQIEAVHKDWVESLRRRINEQFNNADDIKDSVDLFDNVVRAKKEELKHARGDNERFAIALSAVNGFGAMSTSTTVNSLVLFHETVVSGLTTLNVLYTALKGMYDKVRGMGCAVKVVEGFYKDNARLTTLINYDHESIKDLVVNECKEYIYDAGVNVFGTTTAANLIAVGGIDDEKKREILIKHLIKNDKAMNDILEILAQYTDDDLVEIKVNGCIVHMNTSKLRVKVESMIATLKDLFDKFRGIIDHTILSGFENYKGSDGKVLRGSLYYLEEHFLHRFLIGKVSKEDADNEHFSTETLDKINTYFKTIMDHLTRKYTVAITAGGPTPTIADADDKNNRINFHDAITAQIHWDPYVTTNAATVLSTGANVLSGIASFVFKNTTGKDADNTKPGETFKDYQNHPNMLPIYENEAITTNRSLVFMFNQLIANYIKTFYDEATHKIYTPLVNEFATGSFSTQVMKLQTILDIGVAGTNMLEGLEEPSSVLLTSLGLALREIITRVGAGGLKHHIENDLAEIPMYMKESYKAYLPVYSKLFGMLRERAQLLLSLVPELNVARSVAVPGATAQAKILKIVDLEIGVAAVKEDGPMKDSLKAIITQVIDGCRSLEHAMKNVLDELNDSPIFFETYSGSIKDFKAQQGEMPLMPLSSITRYLKRGTNDFSAYPWHTIATPEYKLLFGTRGIMQGDITYGEMPGMAEIVSFHNQTTTARHHMSDKTGADLFTNLAKLAVYLGNIRQYKSLMGTSGNFVENMRIDRNGLTYDAEPNVLLDDKKATCAYKNNIQTTVEFVESVNVKSKRNDLAACVKPDEKCQSRSKMRVLNILDLNIVPINMHMLAREIPLINLYNYSYTFDKFIAELILGRGSECPKDINGVNGSHKRMLCLLLSKPHVIIPKGIDDVNFKRIITGGLGLGLGRPKFLGDELYNKCLLGNVYEGGPTNRLDEGGPTIHSLSIYKNILNNVGNSQMIADFSAGGFMNGVLRTGTGADRIALFNNMNPFVPITTPPVTATDHITNDIRKYFSIIRALNNGRFDALIIGDVKIMEYINNNTTSIDIRTEADTALGAGSNLTSPDDKLDTVLTNLDRLGHIMSVLIYLRLAEKYYKCDVAGAISALKSHMTYLNADHSELKGIIAVDDKVRDLENIGNARFDTKLVRNIMWIVNLQRVMRLKMRKDLSWYNTAIVSSHAVTSDSITEIHGN